MTARLTSGQRQYLSPRRYVPKTLQDARIGCTDHGASALAYIIKRRFDMGRKPAMLRILVDIDHTVYACSKDTESLALLLGEQAAIARRRLHEDRRSRRTSLRICRACSTRGAAR